MTDEFDNEDFLDEQYPEEEDYKEDNNLNILKTFFDEENIVYILLEDGTYKIIQCSGINEAKTLHLAILNR